MNHIIILSCIAAVALIHASFQLSISMLTLLSGHSLGKKASTRRLLKLSSSFVIGASIMTLLLLSSLSFAMIFIKAYFSLAHIWLFIFTLSLATGIAIWIFYYRYKPGTSLWIPRVFAEFLSDRTKATKNSGEAFSLGLTSVLVEILFLIAPLFIASMLLTSLASLWMIGGLLLYITIAMLPLVCIHMLINAGHKISQIQQWREKNKRFLQFAAGSALIVLAFFLYVMYLNSSPMSLIGM